MLAVLVVAVVAVALLLGNQIPRGEAVEVRGYVVALVVDKPGGAATAYYLVVVDGGKIVRYELNLTSAQIALRDGFNAYVGNPDRPVVVRGTVVGNVLVAYEVRDA